MFFVGQAISLISPPPPPLPPPSIRPYKWESSGLQLLSSHVLHSRIFWLNLKRPVCWEDAADKPDDAVKVTRLNGIFGFLQITLKLSKFRGVTVFLTQDKKKKTFTFYCLRSASRRVVRLHCVAMCALLPAWLCLLLGFLPLETQPRALTLQRPAHSYRYYRLNIHAPMVWAGWWWWGWIQRVSKFDVGQRLQRKSCMCAEYLVFKLTGSMRPPIIGRRNSPNEISR